jgi:hypothetical protein
LELVEEAVVRVLAPEPEEADDPLDVALPDVLDLVEEVVPMEMGTP